MLYKAYNDNNELILETPYVSSMVFLEEIDSMDELNRTDEEKVALAQYLTQVYIETDPFIPYTVYVDNTVRLTNEEVFEMDMYDLIDIIVGDNSNEWY